MASSRKLTGDIGLLVGIGNIFQAERQPLHHAEVARREIQRFFQIIVSKGDGRPRSQPANRKHDATMRIGKSHGKYPCCKKTARIIAEFNLRRVAGKPRSFPVIIFILGSYVCNVGDHPDVPEVACNRIVRLAFKIYPVRRAVKRLFSSGVRRWQVCFV